mgnify:CR=1 FL=1
MLKKHFKKLVGLALTAVMLLSMTTTAFASEPVQVLTNNNDVCIVREVTEDGITIATNNKQTGLLTIEKYDSSGNYLQSTETLDLNAITQSVATENDTATPLASSDYVYQHTFSNREYDIYIHTDRTHWYLRSGDNEKSMYGTTSNSENLENFRNAVNDVNSAEFALAGAVGGTALATVITAFLTGGTAAGLAAAGGTAAAAAALGIFDSAISNADYWYAKCNA